MLWEHLVDQWLYALKWSDILWTTLKIVMITYICIKCKESQVSQKRLGAVNHRMVSDSLKPKTHNDLIHGWIWSCQGPKTLDWTNISLIANGGFVLKLKVENKNWKIKPIKKKRRATYRTEHHQKKDKESDDIYESHTIIKKTYFKIQLFFFFLHIWFWSAETLFSKECDGNKMRSVC